MESMAKESIGDEVTKRSLIKSKKNIWGYQNRFRRNTTIKIFKRRTIYSTTDTIERPEKKSEIKLKRE